ncbi:MAG TPA: anti-sigma-D factor RsdA [Mycobacterium sp.]|nr:anti-sigma-D factor RsdA [Mycobacterium sp.]
MPEFGHALGDQPALDELARTDLLLNALAGRRPVDLDDPDDDALATLLEDWRDNLRWPPASGLVSPEEAVEALRTGIADRRRSRRGLAAVGSVAAALLVCSGFGAMVVEARPGDTLHGLHAMFFDQPRVNENQVMLSAKADLAKVQQMIDQGQWDQAQTQLTEVSGIVQSLNDGAGRRDLMDQVNLLKTRVDSRNPNATLPPSAVSTTPPAATTSTMPPSPSLTLSPSQPVSGHRHHGQTLTPSPVVSNTP